MVTKTEVGKCELCGATGACTDVNGQWICLKCQKDNGDKPKEESPADKPVAEDKPTTAITRRTIEAGNRGLALRTIEDMYRFAKFAVASKIVPKSYITPEQIIMAVQTGAEMGMPPMRSLQSFCVVNGVVRMWGDAPLARVRESGLLEYIKEHVEGEDDNRVAICETKRKGDPESKITKFSVADAGLAELWGKAGTWTSYPERMLTYRARSFNLRDNFPDALAGATIAEEYYGHDTNGIPDIEDAKPKSAALLEDEEHAVPAQE